MPIDDQQFAATAGVFLKHLNRMFELAVQDMDTQQIDAMLGVLSGALSGLMLSHMGPWATRERFIALGEHYARLGVEKGFTQ